MGREGRKLDYIICSIELSYRSYVLSQSDEFFARLPYDLLTIGKYVHGVVLRGEHLTDTRSHELYSNMVAQDMHANFTKKFPGRYLTSNAYITVTDAHNKSQTVPIGCRLLLFD